MVAGRGTSLQHRHIDRRQVVGLGPAIGPERYVQFSMAKSKLREAIAAEAARLMLRRKETEYAAARKRAARWLSRRKVDAGDMPSNAEIQTQLYALTGLFSQERQRTALSEIRTSSLELMQRLEAFQPRLFGCAVDGPVLTGSEITMTVTADSTDEVVAVLSEAGFRTRVVPPDEQAAQPVGAGIRLRHRFPCEITLVAENGRAEPAGEGIDIDELRNLIETAHPDPAEPSSHEGPPAVPSEHEYHPDAFGVMRMLLEGLSGVELNRELHPEGEALYHSLQVFELGRAESPYDEEFLLACLLHDVGVGLDRRNPVRAALEALGPLVTERTLFLIEHRQRALEFLTTGQVSRSLRRSEHFDDLVLLARCDRDGRVPGADVPDIEQALAYITGLSTAWDDA